MQGEEEEKFLSESLKDLKNHRARNKNNKRKFENKKVFIQYLYWFDRKNSQRKSASNWFPYTHAHTHAFF